jgi:uncharacterized integral membrane protein
MNREVILYVVLFIIGAVSAFVNGWAFLLEPNNTRSLLFTALGLLIMVAAVVNVRRRMKP